MIGVSEGLVEMGRLARAFEQRADADHWFVLLRSRVPPSSLDVTQRMPVVSEPTSLDGLFDQSELVKRRLRAVGVGELDLLP
jgi:hypothetical protein